MNQCEGQFVLINGGVTSINKRLHSFGCASARALSMLGKWNILLAHYTGTELSLHSSPISTTNTSSYSGPCTGHLTPTMSITTQVHRLTIDVLAAQVQLQQIQGLVSRDKFNSKASVTLQHSVRRVGILGNILVKNSDNTFKMGIHC